ncbi:competence type IV pilus assembly protein ComGB [Enterococcus sp. HY326]|uniref:competence type IV pilus assembly protein ComGB n=1 Tax=Enterococcus sp. HY326 TaxID=2971265 RepID=UPI002240A061|nr:competence type IV pilus assembly protein ComGB [Enterococcus sp. HY326]
MGRKKRKKQRQKFVELLADLLTQGFSINEALLFMEKGAFFDISFINSMQKELQRGTAIHEIFRQNGFLEETVLQIRLANKSGTLASTFKNIANQLSMLEQQQQKLRKTLTYPSILLSFLLIILIAFRQFMLPQLTASGLVAAEDIAILFLNYLPFVLMGIVLVSFTIFWGIQCYFQRKSAIAKATFFAKLPFIQKYYRLYITSFFALEWGKLFRDGLEMRQIIDCMKNAEEKNLMQDLANLLEKQMKKGRGYLKPIQKLPFFTAELSIILQRGTLKGNLGTELIVYSEWLWQKFFQDVERLFVWLQPIIYLVVAVLIIIFYAALLLPIYGNLGGGI